MWSVCSAQQTKIAEIKMYTLRQQQIWNLINVNVTKPAIEWNYYHAYLGTYDFISESHLWGSCYLDSKITNIKFRMTFLRLTLRNICMMLRYKHENVKVDHWHHLFALNQTVRVLDKTQTSWDSWWLTIPDSRIWQCREQLSDRAKKLE